MTFDIIEEQTYKDLACDSIFEDSQDAYNRKFGIITEGTIMAKIAWTSDLLQPIFMEIFSKIFAVGIDQNFAIYDFNTSHRLLFISLDFLFFETIKFKHYLFVATEFEIIVIDTQQWCVIYTIPLLDIYKKLVITGNNIEIYCLNGTFTQYEIDVIPS